MNRRQLLKVIRQAREEGATELYLSGKGITELPPEIGQLAVLRILYLQSNHLTQLPPEIGQLGALDVLRLDKNQLTQLPPEIGQLGALQRLNLYNNQLTRLPPEIGQLNALGELYLHNNQLTRLPPEIGRLSALTYLDLNNNRLAQLPPEIGRLDAIREFSITGNPLEEPPLAIAEKGIEAIRAWFAARKEEGGRPEFLSKMILVGEGGVGKSHTLHNLLKRDSEFDEGTTLGLKVTVDPMELPHPDKSDVTMRLNCWDFGGQHVLHATHQFFLTNRSLFLVVWSARYGWQQGKLEYWLDVVKAKAEDSPVLIVATHTEEWPAELPYEDLCARYPQIKGFYRISNKTGAGIGDLRDAVASVSAKLPLMGAEWPARWLDVAEAVRARRKESAENAKVVDPGDLDAIMGKKNVREKDFSVLREYLHDLGEILCFQDPEGIADRVILDPEWVAMHISHMLADETIEQGLGIFRREHMENVWPTVSGPTRDLFLKLTESFDLSFRTLGRQDISIVVERLDLDAPRPPNDWETPWNAREGEPEIRMRFRLPGSLPPGIPTWFIARAHRFTTYRHWRYGALLKDGAPSENGDTIESSRHLALVRAHDHDRYVELAVRGGAPHNFFTILRDGFEYTLRRYSGLEVERRIPCPGRDGHPCSHEFALDQLEKRFDLRPPKYAVECPECFADQDVRRLLFGLTPSTLDQVTERLDDRFDDLAQGQAALSRDHKRQDADHDIILVSQRTILEEIRELRELAHRQFVEQIDSEWPRIFALRPQDATGWADWLKRAVKGRKLVLHLYCEAPGCWHPALQGGRFEVEDPKAFLNRVTPYLRGLVKALKYATPLSAAALVLSGLGIAPASVALAGAVKGIESVWRNDLEVMENLANHLSEILGTSAPASALLDDYAEDIERLHDTMERRPGGPSRGLAGSLGSPRAMAPLRDFLRAQTAAGKPLGLTRLVTKEDHVFWVCGEHLRQYRADERFAPFPL